MKHLFLIFMLISYTAVLYSQSLNPSDSLIMGIKYKVTLFDEKEIIGTLVSQNEKTLSISSGNILMTIERDNIYSLTTDISPSGYKFLATLNSGTVPNSSEYGSYRSNYIINARFSYFYSEKRNIGLDLSFTPFKEDSYDYAYDYDDGAKETYTDIIANAQIGTFDKKNTVDIYLNLGAGIHIFHRSSYNYTYYSFYDSSNYSYYNRAYTRLYPVLQIGGGLIIKPSYNIGINIEVDMQAYGFGYFFIPVEASFPIKAGLSYYFMK
jgi:hypothetical protein